MPAPSTSPQLTTSLPAPIIDTLTTYALACASCGPIATTPTLDELLARWEHHQNKHKHTSLDT